MALTRRRNRHCSSWTGFLGHQPSLPTRSPYCVVCVCPVLSAASTLLCNRLAGQSMASSHVCEAVPSSTFPASESLQQDVSYRFFSHSYSSCPTVVCRLSFTCSVAFFSYEADTSPPRDDVTIWISKSCHFSPNFSFSLCLSIFSLSLSSKIIHHQPTSTTVHLSLCFPSAGTGAGWKISTFQRKL